MATATAIAPLNAMSIEKKEMMGVTPRRARVRRKVH
jgi:hypothetical protein